MTVLTDADSIRLGAAQVDRIYKGSQRVWHRVTPFLDTFTSATDVNLQSRTSDSGHTWSRVFGTANFIVGSNGRLRGSATDASQTVYSTPWLPPANSYVSQQATVASTATGMRAGFVDSAGAGYYAFWAPATANGNIYGLALRKTDGTGADLVRFTTTGTTGSRWVRLEKRDNANGTQDFRVLAGTLLTNMVEVITWQTRDLTVDGIGELVALGTNNVAATYTATTRIQLGEIQAGRMRVGG